MQESIKAVLGLSIIVAIIGTVLSWYSVDANPGAHVWAWRIGSPIVGVSLFGVFLWMDCLRKDVLPDFLTPMCRNFFERDGFCFAFLTAVIDGQGYLVMPFQNRYLSGLEATVVVVPSQGFVTRAKLQRAEFRVTCGPGEFGTARCKWPIPRKYQGKKRKLDVAAKVRYPEGRGRLVRHRNGVYAGRIDDKLGLTKPAYVMLKLPMGVENDSVGEGPITNVTVEVLWEPTEEDMAASP